MYGSRERASSAEILDRILMDNRKVTDAPSRVEIERRAEELRISVPEAYERERAQRYKAVDSLGNVFLIMNPAAWDLRAGTYHRPKPELIYTAKQAREAAENYSVPPTDPTGMGGRF